ncbi:MAG: hypothetical protein HYR62_04575 [Actinobacteria bacterium]|nr:hypothetical protein [Actinomycetota bacterium]MBI3686506.1 hypothetical protein [Actinomycetota bacterium]
MNGATFHPSLAEVATDVAVGSASASTLHETFRTSTVFCERGDRPGFRALGEPGQGVVPVYSSPEQLALARGTVRWFALSGQDLLAQLPPGYDLLLDMGGSSPLRLRPQALARLVSVDVRALGQPTEGAGHRRAGRRSRTQP